MLHRLAVNETTMLAWTFEQDVQALVNAGVPAMGVWLPKLTDFGDEKAAELLADSDLRVSSLNWVGGFTGADGRTHRESIADALEAVRLASCLNAGCLVLYSGPRGGHIRKQAERLVDEALQAILPLAESLGVVLGVEPVHPAFSTQWSFWDSLPRASEVVRKYKSPHLKLVLDTYHLIDEPDLPLRLDELSDAIALVQLGDARQRPQQQEQNRCPLGEGVAAIPQLIRKLFEVGYEGDFEIELHGEDCEYLDNDRLLVESRDRFLAWADDAMPSSGD